MKVKGQNVPVLRFPGFEGEWDVKKLEDMTSKVSDGIHSTPVYDEQGSYYFINGNNLVNGKGISIIGSKRVSEEQWNIHRRPLGNQTILLSINGTIGSVALYSNEKIILGKSACFINVDEFIEKLFLFQLLQTNIVQRYFTSELTGTTIKNLSLKTIKKTRISFPKNTEQQKIASFLTAVDSKINQLSKKKALLEQYKKGMMQKLFSQELRFKDEQGNEFPDWEEKSLGEVAKIIGGGTPETGNPDYWGGNIQWFTPTEIKQKYLSSSKRTITEDGLKNSSAKKLPIGTLLLSTRATVGDVGISIKECSTNQGFQSLVVKESNVNEYWYYWIKQNKTVLLRRSSGSTFMEISKSEVSKIKVLKPHHSEQQKIATFLSSIDKKISLISTELTHAQSFKKALLQQMFV